MARSRVDECSKYNVTISKRHGRTTRTLPRTKGMFVSTSLTKYFLAADIYSFIQVVGDKLNAAKLARKDRGASVPWPVSELLFLDVGVVLESSLLFLCFSPILNTTTSLSSLDDRRKTIQLRHSTHESDTDWTTRLKATLHTYYLIVSVSVNEAVVDTDRRISGPMSESDSQAGV